MGQSVPSIEWQAVKFPLNLLNFAEEKNTIGPLEKRTLYDADKQMAFILPGVVSWGHKWKDNYWIFKAKKDPRWWTAIFATAQKKEKRFGDRRDSNW